MKYLMLIAVVVICGYIGYGFSSFYNNRLKFFKNLELLFEKLCLEINYSQHKLVTIMQDFSTKNKDVIKLIDNYIQGLNKNESLSSETLFKDIKILNNEEKNIINLFFLSLGKLDVLNQIKQLENQKEQIKSYYQKADDEAKKYVPLYMKLGIIFGLTLALILL